VSIAITPRSLSAGEGAVVELILANEFHGAAELRAQFDLVRVVAEWGVDSVSGDLLVLKSASRSPVGSGVVPVDATVVDEFGSPFGEILLWVTDGYLSAIEYAWYGDESPTAFPDVALITTDVQSAPSQRRVGDGSCEPIAEGLGW
jgi:hypothetical protein